MYPPPPGYNATTIPPWYTPPGKPHASCPDVEHDNCCSCMSDEMQYDDWDNGHCCGACTNICGAGAPGYNATGWYSTMIGENMTQVAVVNSELAITLAFWMNSTEAPSPSFGVELEVAFRRSIAEALFQTAEGSLWPLSTKHVYLNGIVGVPGPGGAAAAQPWYYTLSYFPLNGTNGTTQPSDQNSTMIMLDDEDSQEEDGGPMKILFVNCTVVLPALEFASHTSGGIFVPDFVRRALSVGDPLSDVFQAWLKTRLSAHLRLAPVLNGAIKEVIDTAVMHPAGLTGCVFLPSAKPPRKFFANVGTR